ncbi:MAG: hypothetical protein KatS3mg129_1806 [Leptospiraceae bacterium]|nr:MAG: hypothetical protein KatS3mg129_1806 [Leptospiraceae bacterium]
MKLKHIILGIFIYSFFICCLKFKENPLDPTTPLGFYLTFILNNQSQKEYLIGTDTKNLFVIDLETKTIYFKTLIYHTNSDKIVLATQSKEEPNQLYYIYYNYSTNNSIIKKFDILNQTEISTSNIFNIDDQYNKGFIYDNGYLYFLANNSPDSNLHKLNTTDFTLSTQTLTEISFFNLQNITISNTYLYFSYHDDSYNLLDYVPKDNIFASLTTNILSNFSYYSIPIIFSFIDSSNTGFITVLGDNSSDEPILEAFKEPVDPNNPYIPEKLIINNSSYIQKPFMLYKKSIQTLYGVIQNGSDTQFYSYDINNGTINTNALTLSGIDIQQFILNNDEDQFFIGFKDSNGCSISIREKNNFNLENARIGISTGSTCKITYLQYFKINPLDLSNFIDSLFNESGGS